MILYRGYSNAAECFATSPSFFSDQGFLPSETRLSSLHHCQRISRRHEPISRDVVADAAACQRRMSLRPREDRCTARHHAPSPAATLYAASSRIYGRDPSMNATRPSDCQQPTRRMDERRPNSGENRYCRCRHMVSGDSTVFAWTQRYAALMGGSVRDRISGDRFRRLEMRDQ